LRDFINTYLQRVAVDCEPLWHSQLLMRELSHPTDFCSEFAREFVRPNLEILHGILHEMLPGLSKRKLFLCGSSIVGQILHYRFARPVIRALSTELELPQLDINTLGKHIYEFSLAALRSLAARQRRKESS
jgi:hypothetical protein